MYIVSLLLHGDSVWARDQSQALHFIFHMQVHKEQVESALDPVFSLLR